MRRAALLLAVTLTALSPAATRAQDLSGAPVFGSATCAMSFPCPNSSDSESLRYATPEIIASANKCVEDRLSYRSNPGGFFEESMGLDSSLCLTTKSLPASEAGLTMVPKCCIETKAPGSCTLVCIKYGIK